MFAKHYNQIKPLSKEKKIKLYKISLRQQVSTNCGRLNVPLVEVEAHPAVPAQRADPGSAVGPKNPVTSSLS